MLSKASLRFSDMMMVPSMANNRSLNVWRTVLITFCIRSISCRKKMFTGCNAPIFWRRPFTLKKKVRSRVDSPTLVISNIRCLEHLLFRTLVISNNRYLKHSLSRTLVVSNTRYLKLSLFRTLVISNTRYFEQSLFRTLVISNTRYLEQYLCHLLDFSTCHSLSYWESTAH